MKNWDDHRFFLAVARNSSVKKAAEQLNVNRSTVLRRINAFEKNIGVRLFDRLPNGYFTTTAGDEIIDTAQKMEAAAQEANRRIAGRDERLSGTIRVSISSALASYILMDDLAIFSKNNPHINLELIATYDMPDLHAREADVAIRISDQPPDDLVGRRILKVARSVYCATNKKNTSQPLNWIGWSTDFASMKLLQESDFASLPISLTITDPYVTVKAVESGLGITVLPCYMGDSEKGLSRIPPDNILRQTDLWVLTHKDLRNTARIRKFTDFISKALLKHKNLLEGKCEK